MKNNETNYCIDSTEKAKNNKSLNSFLIAGPMYLIGLILLGGGIKFSNGYWLDSNYEAVRHSGNIVFFSVGKGEAIGIVDPNGKLLASCHNLDCGYDNYKNDIGKEAEFTLKNNKVFEISVDRAIKVREEDVATRNHGKQILGSLLFSSGLILFFLGYLKSRKNY
jgi:hypothetical protein